MNTKTKTGILEYLSSKLKKAKILPLMRVYDYEYKASPEYALSKIQDYFDEEILIARSSAKTEDTSETSNAGKYSSVMDVTKSDSKLLDSAINEVFNSYGDYSGEEEILIQPMLKDLKISGVATTADINTLAPYYIINYSEDGDSESVTSGKKSIHKSYVSFRHSNIDHKEKFLKEVIDACKEIEEIFNNRYLDIEFGIDNNYELYIFQVRPIVLSNKKNLSRINLQDSLRKIHKKIEKLSNSHPNLLGSKAIYGVMPDWNPAEIIGLRPKRLGLSLYKELITDSIWAYQRDSYGYRNLRSHPLLISFLGVPYVDVRVSFNSFIPKQLDENIAEKLVEYYLLKLQDTPKFHDKVEFEIIHSCYYLTLSEKLEELLEYGFNKNEIKRIEFALLCLTNEIIETNDGIYKKDLKKIEVLKEKYNQILASQLSTIDKIYWLIENCKRYGTLPFAGLARAGFMAVQFLKSFVETGILSKDDFHSYMNSLNTVSKHLQSDLEKLSQKKISHNDFINKYGHLRPGTYDIMSPSYKDNFEGYFSINADNYVQHEEFRLTEEQVVKLNTALRENGINSNADKIFQFIKDAIEGREYLKFVFTKSLSTILDLIDEFGARFAISKDDLAYLDIQKVRELYSSLDQRDVREIFMENINRNKMLYEHTEAVKLPSLITSPGDIYNFYIEDEEPNFITMGRIVSDTVMEKDIGNNELQNKIVCIQSADPGYDFLFTKNIGGLITQFGGANSHMSIRCAELGIPSVIGAGENNFLNWSNAKVVDIDCANKQVNIVS